MPGAIALGLAGLTLGLAAAPTDCIGSDPLGGAATGLLFATLGALLAGAGFSVGPMWRERRERTRPWWAAVAGFLCTLAAGVVTLVAFAALALRCIDLVFL